MTFQELIKEALTYDTKQLLHGAAWGGTAGALGDILKQAIVDKKKLKELDWRGAGLKGAIGAGIGSAFYYPKKWTSPEKTAGVVDFAKRFGGDWSSQKQTLLTSGLAGAATGIGDIIKQKLVDKKKFKDIKYGEVLRNAALGAGGAYLYQNAARAWSGGMTPTEAAIHNKKVNEANAARVQLLNDTAARAANAEKAIKALRSNHQQISDFLVEQGKASDEHKALTHSLAAAFVQHINNPHPGKETTNSSLNIMYTIEKFASAPESPIGPHMQNVAMYQSALSVLNGEVPIDQIPQEHITDELQMQANLVPEDREAEKAKYMARIGAELQAAESKANNPDDQKEIEIQKEGLGL